MEGADVLDFVQNGCRFSQEMLDVRAVLADNIRIVPPRFVNPVTVEIDFVGKEPAVEGDERTKGIGGKEDAVRQVQSDHGFRPVHHRCGYIGDRMLAETLGVSFFDFNQSWLSIRKPNWRMSMNDFSVLMILTLG